jgi:hypothetical protein
MSIRKNLICCFDLPYIRKVQRALVESPAGCAMAQFNGAGIAHGVIRLKTQELKREMLKAGKGICLAEEILRIASGEKLFGCGAFIRPP